MARALKRLLCIAAAMIAVACLGGAPPCQPYAEEFDSFGGPANFEDETVVVKWCVTGATIATGGFCQTGKVLKLDSSTDDPLIWVKMLGDDCTSVSLTFTYSQFSSTGTLLKRSVGADSTLNCSKQVTTTAAALNVVGGACVTIIDTVNVASGQSVYWRFDHGTPGTNAIFLDSVAISVGGCCPSHPCCEVGSAGCDDAIVQGCVCSIDPFCCEQAWDQICADEVTSLGCGDCDVREPSDCLTALTTDFGDFFESGSVCSLLPETFESCEGGWPYISSTSSCGGSLDMTMRFSPGFPYSTAITRCLDLTAAKAPLLSFTYSKNSGTLGPKIDVSVDDGRFEPLWSAPVSPPAGCISQTVNLADFAGLTNVRLKFSSGSTVNNGAAFDDLLLLSAPPPHDCCSVGDKGCATESIQACVCAVDPFCCDTEWDALCVQQAAACGADCDQAPMCGSASAGDCLVAHLTPYCSDADCCVSICFVDPFCCDSAWDELCASEAAAVCAGGACGQNGACASAQRSAGCSDSACCSIVCMIDPICCLASWDATCVSEAAILCKSATIGDLDGNSVVDGADLGLFLGSWGLSGVAADLNQDGVVDGADLGILLANWTQ
jgi:hypothetical protein